MPTDPKIIGATLGLSDEEMEDALARDKAYEEGKPAMIAGIYENMEKMEEDPYKPRLNFAKEDRKMARAKKVLGPNERDWTEKIFMQHFEKWALEYGTSSAVFEGKATPGTSLPFDRLEPHQKAFLLKAKHEKAYYHPADTGNSLGIKQRLPCDAFFVTKVKSFIVVMFRVRERNNRCFYLIDIDKWCEEEAKGESKSLTEERARMIGVRCSL